MEVCGMSEITDINEFRKLKGRRDSTDNVEVEHGDGVAPLEGATRKQYDQYIELMRMVIRTSIKPRMDLLYLDCISEDDADFRDKDNNLIDYRTDYAPSFPLDSAKEDIIISSIVNYAPKKIIIRNSDALNAYFLYALKGIFMGLVQIEI
jgi:hypothetical protein